MQHHPVFARFRGYEGPRPEGVDIDWIGFRTLLTKWLDPALWAFVASDPGGGPPGLTEEYFEWIDLLEAVGAAEGTFTMLELGAGYGRWGIRGALAAAQRGLATRLALVEAEPQHAAWAREALTLNGVNGEVVEAAIAYDGESVPFSVFRGPGDRNAGNWYGQQISGASILERTDDTYFGYPVWQDEWGEHIRVPAKRLEQVADGLDVIDFIDADLQGAELELVTGSIGFLSERVRRAHIGTHSEAIEQVLRQTFSNAGWRPVWDFSLGGERLTPFGPCNFQDGVQSWENPLLNQ